MQSATKYSQWHEYFATLGTCTIEHLQMVINGNTSFDLASSDYLTLEQQTELIKECVCVMYKALMKPETIFLEGSHPRVVANAVYIYLEVVESDMKHPVDDCEVQTQLEERDFMLCALYISYVHEIIYVLKDYENIPSVQKFKSFMLDTYSVDVGAAFKDYVDYLEKKSEFAKTFFPEYFLESFEMYCQDSKLV